MPPTRAFPYSSILGMSCRGFPVILEQTPVDAKRAVAGTSPRSYRGNFSLRKLASASGRWSLITRREPPVESDDPCRLATHDW
jgi:hypothetical protein